MAYRKKRKFSSQEIASFNEGKSIGKHLRKSQRNKVSENIKGYQMMIRRELDKVDKTNIAYAKGAICGLRKK